MSGRQLSRAGLTNEETANSSPSLLSIEVIAGDCGSSADWSTVRRLQTARLVHA